MGFWTLQTSSADEKIQANRGGVMSYRSQRAFVLIAFVVLATACCGQRARNRDVGEAPHRQDHRAMSYDCADSAGGRPRPSSSWMLKGSDSTPHRVRRSAHNDCPASTCNR
jgi:hypothetical protein